MLDNLIRYFTAALPQLRQEEAPLAQEMRLVEAYLAIYRVRMGTRLTFEVALPRNLAEVHVSTMMLLTLVENALKQVSTRWSRAAASASAPAMTRPRCC